MQRVKSAAAAVRKSKTLRAIASTVVDTANTAAYVGHEIGKEGIRGARTARRSLMRARCDHAMANPNARVSWLPKHMPRELCNRADLEQPTRASDEMLLQALFEANLSSEDILGLTGMSPVALAADYGWILHAHEYDEDAIKLSDDKRERLRKEYGYLTDTKYRELANHRSPYSKHRISAWQIEHNQAPTVDHLREVLPHDLCRYHLGGPYPNDPETRGLIAHEFGRRSATPAFCRDPTLPKTQPWTDRDLHLAWWAEEGHQANDFYGGPYSHPPALKTKMENVRDVIRYSPVDLRGKDKYSFGFCWQDHPEASVSEIIAKYGDPGENCGRPSARGT